MRSIAMPPSTVWVTGVAMPLRPPELNALYCQRDALPDANAHGAQRALAAGASELIGRGGRQSRAAGAQWMAQCNGPPVGIDVRRVVREVQRAQHRKSLGSKSFVEFDE